MTPQQINAVIATDLGWAPDHVYGAFRPGHVTKQYDIWVKPDGGRIYQEDSDFSTSLDAIRAAALERFRTVDEQSLFEDYLYVRCVIHNAKAGFNCFWQLTAADWCEAYLRAVVKWSETEAKA